jgi:hypothetical protein
MQGAGAGAGAAGQRKLCSRRMRGGAHVGTCLVSLAEIVGCCRRKGLHQRCRWDGLEAALGEAPSTRQLLTTTLQLGDSGVGPAVPPLVDLLHVVRSMSPDLPPSDQLGGGAARSE